MAATVNTSPKKPFQLTPPPKEFFRQFANLAHNRVLNEDFPHEKHLTLKYKGAGRDFIVNGKGSISVKTVGKTTEETTAEGKKVEIHEYKDTYPTSSEVKFLTAFHETSTEARFNSKGITKIWTNWGVHKVGEPIEIVSVVKSDNCFEKSKIWAAAYYTRGAVGSATRFQVRRVKKDFIFNVSEKLTFSQKDFWGGAYVDFNLNDLKLTQYNAILGYNLNKKIHFYAEHATSKPVAPKATPKVTETTTTVTETTKTVEGTNGPLETKKEVTVESTTETKVPFLKRIGFGKGTFNAVYKDDKFWALAQAGWEEPTEKFTFEAGVVYTVNRDSSVRAKINKDLDLTVGARHRFNRNISLNIGTQVPLKTPEKFYNKVNTVPVPFGASLEFNF